MNTFRPAISFFIAIPTPTRHSVLLDEQIKLSKRRTLVVEDMILSGANHLTQFTTDPHRG